MILIACAHFKLVNVLFVRGNVENGGRRVGHFDRKLDSFISFHKFNLQIKVDLSIGYYMEQENKEYIHKKFDGRVDAAGVAGEEAMRRLLRRRLSAVGARLLLLLLLFVEQLVDGDVDERVVVVADLHVDADERHVGEVDVAEEVVAVYLTRIEIELEMMVGELEATDGQDHGLMEADGARVEQTLAAEAVERERPQVRKRAQIALVARQTPQLGRVQSAEALVAAVEFVVDHVLIGACKGRQPADRRRRRRRRR